MQRMTCELQETCTSGDSSASCFGRKQIVRKAAPLGRIAFRYSLFFVSGALRGFFDFEARISSAMLSLHSRQD